MSLDDEVVNKELVVVCVEVVKLPPTQTVLGILLEVAARTHFVDCLGFEITITVTVTIRVKGDSLLLIKRFNIGKFTFVVLAFKKIILFPVRAILHVV